MIATLALAALERRGDNSKPWFGPGLPTVLVLHKLPFAETNICDFPLLALKGIENCLENK